MTRYRWVDEVVKPWKQGDELQVRGKDCQKLKWCDIDCTDPIFFAVMLREYDYRIKPRVVKYVVEYAENISPHLFEEVAKAMESVVLGREELNFSKDFIEAIRNAKPLKEGEK